MRSALLLCLFLPHRPLAISQADHMILEDVELIGIHSSILFHKSIVLQLMCQACLHKSYYSLYQDTILHYKMLQQNLRSRIAYISATILFLSIFRTFVLIQDYHTVAQDTKSRSKTNQL